MRSNIACFAWNKTGYHRVLHSMIFSADLESNLNDLFQIECDAANAMMKIRFGPTPTRFCTQKGASCDPKKVGWRYTIDHFSFYWLQVFIYLGRFKLRTYGWSLSKFTTRCLLRLWRFWCHVWWCPATGHGSRWWSNATVGLEHRLRSMWNDLQQQWISWRDFYFFWNLLEWTNEIRRRYFLHSSQPGLYDLTSRIDWLNLKIILQSANMITSFSLNYRGRFWWNCKCKI